MAGSAFPEDPSFILPLARDLSPPQQQALLAEAMACMARIVDLEILVKDKQVAEGEALAIIHHARLRLGKQIQQTRVTLQAQDSAAADPGTPIAPQAVAAAYQALPRFSHTLGAIRGAVDSGPEVSNLQRLLSLEGWPVAVSGKYDTATALAVRQLQAKYKLQQQDGLVGGETRRLLNRLTGHERP